MEIFSKRSHNQTLNLCHTKPDFFQFKEEILSRTTGIMAFDLLRIATLLTNFAASDLQFFVTEYQLPNKFNSQRYTNVP